MSTAFAYPDSVKALTAGLQTAVEVGKMSVAVIDPDLQCRKTACSAIETINDVSVSAETGYLSAPEAAKLLADHAVQAVFVAIDTNVEQALQMVQTLCAIGSPTVMVYSRNGDHDLMMRAMWAGAREFLFAPLSADEVEGALARIAARTRPAAVPKRKTAGRSFVFLGAKGGSGVTTLATNFAVALAREPAETTLLIDLDVPNGDAALDLGITSQYSTLDALRDAGSLNTASLSKLVVQHDSGLWVLGAPGNFQKVEISNQAVDRLLQVATQSFDSVVIDAGVRSDWTGTCLLANASIIYLVTQVGIPELRNANRVITESVSAYSARLQVVLNRYSPRMFSIDDDAIERALTVSPSWRIQSDFLTVQRMKLQSAPLISEDSPIARMIDKMALAACGRSAVLTKKKGARPLEFIRALGNRI